MLTDWASAPGFGLLYSAVDVHVGNLGVADIVISMHELTLDEAKPSGR